MSTLLIVYRQKDREVAGIVCWGKHWKLNQLEGVRTSDLKKTHKLIFGAQKTTKCGISGWVQGWLWREEVTEPFVKRSSTSGNKNMQRISKDDQLSALSYPPWQPL